MEVDAEQEPKEGLLHHPPPPAQLPDEPPALPLLETEQHHQQSSAHPQSHHQVHGLSVSYLGLMWCFVVSWLSFDSGRWCGGYVVWAWQWH